MIPASSSKSSALAAGNEVRPIIKDPNLKLELVSRGLHRPTSMAFLGPDDILVLEKDNGTVRRIINGTVLAEPLLDVPVAINSERGMLGIAVAHHETTKTVHIFLYYTESEKEDGEDFSRAKEPLGNRLYRYELVGNRLIDSKLLLDFPAGPRGTHNGGVTLIGPDNNLYIVIGDLEGHNPQSEEKLLDGRSGILAISQDGKALDNKRTLGDDDPLDKYYAYGIRNSFGIDFDPVTGNMWDTENGPGFGDEINLVEPGFNSGWKEIQGIWKYENYSSGSDTKLETDKLDDFGGKAKYSDPEFTWQNTIGVSALKFLASDKLGEKYQNDIFVGDINNGYIYHFDLQQNRKELLLSGQLEDRVANSNDDLESIIFGTGFNGSKRAFVGISDMEVGPYDGFLYIVSLGQGAIYRIVPRDFAINN